MTWGGGPPASHADDQNEQLLHDIQANARQKQILQGKLAECERKEKILQKRLDEHANSANDDFPPLGGGNKNDDFPPLGGGNKNDDFPPLGGGGKHDESTAPASGGGSWASMAAKNRPAKKPQTQWQKRPVTNQVKTNWMRACEYDRRCMAPRDLSQAHCDTIFFPEHTKDKQCLWKFLSYLEKAEHWVDVGGGGE